MQILGWGPIGVGRALNPMIGVLIRRSLIRSRDPEKHRGGQVTRGRDDDIAASQGPPATSRSWEQATEQGASLTKAPDFGLLASRTVRG